MGGINLRGEHPLNMRLKALLLERIEQGVWELRRKGRFFTRQFGLFGWVVLVCAVIGLVSFLVVFEQNAQKKILQARISERISLDKIHSSRVTPIDYLNKSNTTDSRARLKDFDLFLLPHEDIPVAVQDLLRLADDEGLLIQRGEYRPQNDIAGNFMRYRMSLPVKGTAAKIHHFIQAALLAQKNLALEGVQFKRERIESADIEASIQWVLLTKLPNQKTAIVVSATKTELSK